MIANVTITRNNHDEINITIGDETSGLRIVSVRMDLQEFAMVITGLAHSKGEITQPPTAFTVENIGKKREVKPFLVEKSKIFNKNEQKAIVLKELADSGVIEYGWMLFDDGTGSQQPGDKHHATIYRFVDER